MLGFTGARCAAQLGGDRLLVVLDLGQSPAGSQDPVYRCEHRTDVVVRDLLVTQPMLDVRA